MSAGAGDAVREKVLRALQISGRRLVQLGPDMWGVMLGRLDRRRRPIVRVDGETVMQLIAAGEIVSTGEQVWVLRTDAVVPIAPPAQWVFTATGARRAGERMRGFGFVGMARQARAGGGPISLRQALAGLRLIADAERAAADARLTMDWDAGPTTRQRRGASGGGRAGDALAAAQRLRQVRGRVDEAAWRLAWALCVDGETRVAVMKRFGITHTFIKARVAEALEQVAVAYEWGGRSG